MSPQPYVQALEKLTDLAVLAMFVTGCEAGELNLGGGFPICWSEEDDPPQVAPILYAIAQNMRMMCERKGMSAPCVSVEPGRAIVAEAGTLVTRVYAVKRTEGFRPYAALDVRAPRAVDPAYANRSPVFLLANRPNDQDEEIFALADRTGDPDGILTWEAYLPEVHAGDLIAQLSAGAVPWPERGPGSPTVLIAQYGHATPIVQRPDAQYFVRLDVVPSRLNR
jgi:diaminopimelate decarboxylase